MAGPVLLAGHTGMLGSAFARLLGEPPRLLDRAALDVTDPAGLLARIRGAAPAIVVNCVADTNVEAAEDAPARAFAVNALLPGLLAQACREAGALLVHFSSTGCYGGASTTPHSDYEALQPPTAHHRSKAAGEDEVRAAGCRHLILRLGWLYGGGIGHSKNFVWSRIVEARGKAEMKSDPHQAGSPSFVDDVVAQTRTLLAAGITGTYNCVAAGAVSRYDYVRRILELAGRDVRLLPARFNRRAPVAANEAAVNDKLDQMRLNRMPAWDEALARYVAALLAAEAGG